MKGISSEERDRIEIPKTILDSPGSSLKVRRSVAVLGLALSVGTTGVLINQQNSKDLRVTPIAQSPQTLADVLSQNKDRKYEMARAAIASGSWDNHKGVLVHEVRKDETLFKLTQQYQIDAARSLHQTVSVLPHHCSLVQNCSFPGYWHCLQSQIWDTLDANFQVLQSCQK
ncbi:MAG: hypothetical protein HC856_05925 [Pseudanabaena sp. RU_4_16]|nr:hypothetical protein [Pseudanabaena sp. RU_4_16]